VIDQAIAIMARRGRRADEAFAVLRRISNDRNVKLRDAAAMAEAVASGKRDALGV
jgi:AmiR/NasT family two-component response regulator